MNELPSHFEWFRKKFPAVNAGYEKLGEQVHGAGPLDPKTRALIKIAISAAARLEGGLHAHVRKAVAAGVSADEIYHTLLLLLPTTGFPAMMAALAWTRDVLEE